MPNSRIITPAGIEVLMGQRVCGGGQELRIGSFSPASRTGVFVLLINRPSRSSAHDQDEVVLK